MDPSLKLFISLLFGGVGMGLFIYGKKQQNGVAFGCGVALCVLPYFITNTVLLLIAGMVLMALPFFLRD